MIITINLNKLDLTQLAQLHAILLFSGQHCAAEEVKSAGIANAGQDDWDFEVRSLSKLE